MGRDPVKMDHIPPPFTPMGGGPPSRIPPYIGVVDKKRGDNPVKEILGKNYWEVGIPLS